MHYKNGVGFSAIQRGHTHRTANKETHEGGA